jgi:hypothetical protein
MIVAVVIVFKGDFCFVMLANGFTVLLAVVALATVVPVTDIRVDIEALCAGGTFVVVTLDVVAFATVGILAVAAVIVGVAAEVVALADVSLGPGLTVVCAAGVGVWLGVTEALVSSESSLSSPVLFCQPNRPWLATFAGIAHPQCRRAKQQMISEAIGITMLNVMPISRVC